MALNGVLLSLLAQSIQKRKEAIGVERPLTALALSYPDALVTRAMVEGILGAKLTASVKIVPPEEARAVWDWHQMAGTQEPLFDTDSLFTAMGLDTTFIDIVQARGMERIVDLNEPLPADICRRFDLVIDTGTLEHCFNVGMAFRNVCEALTVGGLWVHCAPLNMVNHGFWNFNPTIYPDYLEDNGFAIRFMQGSAGTARDGFQKFDIKPFARFDLPLASIIYVIAERLKLQDQVWPVQRKYRPAKD